MIHEKIVLQFYLSAMEDYLELQFFESINNFSHKRPFLVIYREMLESIKIDYNGLECKFVPEDLPANLTLKVDPEISVE